MNENLVILGSCPEIPRVGVFDLERILEISPRILKSMKGKEIEVGNVVGVMNSGIFRNRYELKTTGKNVPLDLLKRDVGNEVLLCLSNGYSFGREMMDGYQ